MKYTKEQRLDIGRRIYDGEITKYDAAEQYDISYQTARDYMRLYRNVNHLPPKRGRPSSSETSVQKPVPERQVQEFPLPSFYACFSHGANYTIF